MLLLVLMMGQQFKAIKLRQENSETYQLYAPVEIVCSKMPKKGQMSPSMQADGWIFFLGDNDDERYYIIGA